jgi:hypothetical protein
VTQKVREAEPAREKSKSKGKKVNDMTMEEKLKAERAIIQKMIDQLEL